MKNETLANNIILMWIVLWSTNFLNMQRYFLLAGCPMAIYLLAKNKKTSKSFIISVFLIFSFSAFYAMMSVQSKGIFFIVEYLLTPCSSFVIGYYYIRKSKKIFRESILTLFDFISFGMMIYSTLNMSYLFIHGWSYAHRGTVDFWTGISMNATNQGGYLSLTCAYLPLILLLRNHIGKKRTILYMIEIVLAIIYTLLLANRTYLIVIVAVLIVSYLFYFMEQENKGFFLIKSFIIIVVFLVISLIVYDEDLFGIKTFWENTTLYDRLQYVGTKYDVTIRENDRFSAWRLTIASIPDHLLGGKPDTVFLSYAHNLWLDIQWVAGVIPLVLMIIISIKFLFDSVLLYKKLINDKVTAMFIVGYVVSIMLEFMAEPIIEGYYYLFIVFFVFYGAFLAYKDVALSRGEHLY